MVRSGHGITRALVVEIKAIACNEPGTSGHKQHGGVWREAIGEAANAERIAYGMPDVLRGQRSRYANKVVAVLGTGHSAVGTILDLAQLKKDEPATEIVWVLRGDSPAKSFGGGANDKLSARGELGKVLAQLVQGGGVRVETGFRLTHITLSGEKLRLGAGSACCGRHVDADAQPDLAQDAQTR